MMPEDICPNLKPNAEWIKGEDPDNCPPCLIKPLAEFYLGALGDANDQKHVEVLLEAWDTGEVLTIATAMDNIKSEVGEPLKQVLRGFDCSAQTLKLSET
jgi:hypothetical protein